MYELIILSCLMRRPAHGYLIAKIINDIIGPYAKISHGRLYPLLAKLVNDGLIVTCEDACGGKLRERTPHAYAIAEAGRRRFHELMMDLTNNPGDYQKVFSMKVCNLDLVQPTERVSIIEHYITYCQTHILHQRKETDDMLKLAQDDNQQGAPENYRAIIAVMNHYVHHWQSELAWAQELLSKVQSESACSS
ncbi:MAG TPA: PadR family transcriptional regulator [Dictyobacter sp.]|jgi:DNA-binding PadR family transcriptional regulator|nr:PadR family transcriptional regulator [Dictyobacter sp.]